MLRQVRRTLVQRQLISPGFGVLVGISGGPDSAALLLALARLAPEFALRLEAATVDHGLRTSSAGDAEIAVQQATRLGIPCSVLRLDGIRDKDQTDTGTFGQSLQAKARAGRYAALLNHASSRGLEVVAVGHTLDDQAETTLLRLIRGAGTRGLSGIDAKRADGVVRPLIDVRRSAAAAFAATEDWPIARDPANEDPRFERVRLRQEVLPVLSRDHGEVAVHLAALADESRALHALVRDLATAWLRAKGASDALQPSLKDEPAPVRTEVFRQFFEPVLSRPLGRDHLDALEHCLMFGEEGSSVLLPGGRRVVRDTSGSLFLEAEGDLRLRGRTSNATPHEEQ